MLITSKDIKLKPALISNIYPDHMVLKKPFEIVLILSLTTFRQLQERRGSYQAQAENHLSLKVSFFLHIEERQPSLLLPQPGV